jgi:hypothetical protein
MGRRPKAAGLDPFADLAKKVEILEREMLLQEQALERLKKMSASRDTEARLEKRVIQQTYGRRPFMS